MKVTIVGAGNMGRGIRPASDYYYTAGALLLVGLVLWVINRLIVGRVEFDPQKLTKAD